MAATMLARTAVAASLAALMTASPAAAAVVVPGGSITVTGEARPYEALEFGVAGADVYRVTLTIGGMANPFALYRLNEPGVLTGDYAAIPLTSGSYYLLPQFAVEPSGFAYSFTVASVAAPVPEPAAWLLLILGFGACGAALRRARSDAARRLVQAGAQR